MTGDAQINPPMDGQQLVQENLVLRAIVAELLMKN